MLFLCVCLNDSFLTLCCFFWTYFFFFFFLWCFLTIFNFLNINHLFWTLWTLIYWSHYFFCLWLFYFSLNFNMIRYFTSLWRWVLINGIILFKFPEFTWFCKFSNHFKMLSTHNQLSTEIKGWYFIFVFSLTLFKSIFNVFLLRKINI